MFDRLFNIFRANLGDMMPNRERSNNEDGDLARQYDEWKRQQEQSQHAQGNAGSQTFLHEEQEHYVNLELRTGATFEEIKASYKRLIKQYHPDRFHNDPSKHKTALEITQRLNRSYNYFEQKFGR
jgi:DnaJ-domain-containing protein 1